MRQFEIDSGSIRRAPAASATPSQTRSPDTETRLPVPGHIESPSLASERTPDELEGLALANRSPSDGTENGNRASSPDKPASAQRWRLWESDP